MKNKLIILCLFNSLYCFSQEKNVEELIRTGNDHYREQQFAKASQEYTKALATDPANTTAKFNQGNALYKQDKKVEAAVLFTEVASKATDAALRSKTFYNKGVILSQQKNIEESIEAYKSALRNDPADKEARENLQKALLELKKKNEQKKEDQQKKKKEDQQKQPQSKMNPKEAEQRLKLLQQKEKETQQKVQKEKAKTGGSQAKDW